MGRGPSLGRRQSRHHRAVLSRCHTISARAQSSAAPQSSIPGLSGGRFPAMLGVLHGRSLRVRLADSLRHFHGPRLAGTPGAERTALSDARTRSDPGADAFCPAAIRAGLPPLAADGLGRPAAPRGSLSDRLFAPPRGWSLLVGDQCRAAAYQYQHSNVPCDLLVRHLPARRADALLWSAPARHDPGGARRVEAFGGTVGAPVSLYLSVIRRYRRYRLWPQCPYRVARDAAALVRLLPQRHRHGDSRGGPRKDLCDGRECLARRAGMAAGAHTLYTILPAQSGTGQ